MTERRGLRRLALAHLGFLVIVVTPGCTSDAPDDDVPTCGNEQIDLGEECEGDDLNDRTCTDLGFDEGTLACTDECAFDTSGCEVVDECEGVVECSAGATDEEECGHCGVRRRVCNADCTWGEWSECEGAGVCDPEVGVSLECVTECGSIGTEQCTDSCEWSGVCEPPTEECNNIDDDCDGEVDNGDVCPLCEDGSEVAVVYTEGSTRKVCQLTGDFDQHLGVPTSNRTEERFGLRKTDLGASFEHDGGLFFFFGDSVDRSGGFVGDAMATSADLDPSDCVDLEFLMNEHGRFLPPVVPGIALGGCEVPMEGVSVGGAIYGYFTTDAAAGCDMGRSVVARSDDEGRTWRYLYDLSTTRFINVSVVRAEADSLRGLPEDVEGDVLLLWGSGRYRRSDLSLAIQPVDSIEDPTTIRYFEGTDLDSCAPRFGVDEGSAVGLLGVGCIGEVSVFFAPSLGRWVVLYNCSDPRGVTFHTSRWPWGPWSDGAVLFQPFADGGYCVFMHQPGCDSLDDPAPGQAPGHWGGEYGPYVLPTFVSGEAGEATFYFTMSTWNPYQSVLMETRLVME